MPRDRNSVAIIGLDGLDPLDIRAFNIPGTWDTLEIETVAHTQASWNAIFSGRERDGIYNFWHVPENADEDSLSGRLGHHSDDPWEYPELDTEDFLWNRFDIEVVSAPVVLQTFSTLDDPPPNEVTWSTSAKEIDRSIPDLLSHTLNRDRVITVFPHPDKPHHLVDNPAKFYSAADRREHMIQLREAVARITDSFERWVLLSDHGRPGPPESIPYGNLKIASHDTPGVIRSNVIETRGYTNISIYDELVGLLAE